MYSKRFLSSFLKSTSAKNSSSPIPVDVVAAYIAFYDNFIAERELDYKLKSIERERILRMRELKREITALKSELVKNQGQFMKCHRVFSVETFISDSPMKNYIRDLPFGPKPCKGKMGSGTLRRLQKLLQELEMEEIAQSFFPRPKAVKAGKNKRPQTSKPKDESTDTVAKARKYTRIKSAPPRSHSTSSSVTSSLNDSSSSAFADLSKMGKKASLLVSQIDLKTKHERLEKRPSRSPKPGWGGDHSKSSDKVSSNQVKQQNVTKTHYARAKSAATRGRQPSLSEQTQTNRPSTATIASRFSQHNSNLKNVVSADKAVFKESSSNLKEQRLLSAKDEDFTSSEKRESIQPAESETIDESEEKQLSHPTAITDPKLYRSSKGAKYAVKDLVNASLSRQSLQNKNVADKKTIKTKSTIEITSKTSRSVSQKSGFSSNIRGKAGQDKTASSEPHMTDKEERAIGIQEEPISGVSVKEVPIDMVKCLKTSSSAHSESSDDAENTFRKVTTNRREAVFLPNKQSTLETAPQNCRRFSKTEKRTSVQASGLPTVRGKRVSLYHLSTVVLSASLFRKHLNRDDDLRGKVHQFISTKKH